MHWIYLEYKITQEELAANLKECFPKNDFFYLEESMPNGIGFLLFDNGSYLSSQIQLNIHQEDRGFWYADKFAEHLSAKYKCDTVRELHIKVALKEFNNEQAIQHFSVLNRDGKKYIILDDGIEEEGFEVKINRELNLEN